MYLFGTFVFYGLVCKMLNIYVLPCGAMVVHNTLQESPFSLLALVSPLNFHLATEPEGQVMKKEQEAGKAKSLPSSLPLFSNLLILCLPNPIAQRRSITKSDCQSIPPAWLLQPQRAYGQQGLHPATYKLLLSDDFMAREYQCFLKQELKHWHCLQLSCVSEHSCWLRFACHSSWTLLFLTFLPTTDLINLQSNIPASRLSVWVCWSYLLPLGGSLWTGLLTVPVLQSAL